MKPNGNTPSDIDIGSFISYFQPDFGRNDEDDDFGYVDVIYEEVNEPTTEKESFSNLTFTFFLC